MPSRTKGERWLAAFVCAALVFDVSANLTPWALRERCVDGGKWAYSIQEWGHAWRLASYLLEELPRGDFDLFLANLPQATVLFLFACAAGLVAFKVAGRGRQGETHSSRLRCEAEP